METTGYLIERKTRTGRRLDFYAGTSEHGPRFTSLARNAYQFRTAGDVETVLEALRESEPRYDFAPAELLAAAGVNTLSWVGSRL